MKLQILYEAAAVAQTVITWCLRIICWFPYVMFPICSFLVLSRRSPSQQTDIKANRTADQKPDVVITSILSQHLNTTTSCVLKFTLEDQASFFLHIKPYDKGISDHVRCSTAFLWQTMKSRELVLLADVTASWKWLKTKEALKISIASTIRGKRIV